MRSRPRTRPLAAGPSTRRHRRASPRAALAIEWLEARRVPSALAAAPAGVAAPVVVTNNGPVPAGTPVTLTVAVGAGRGSFGPLTYRFDFLDDGNFEVTDASGIASWTYDVPGVHAIDVRVSDRVGVIDAPTSVVVTTPAPTVTPPADQPAVEGTAAEFALGRFSQAGGTGPWNVTVDWGDGSAASTFVATTAGGLGTLPHAYGTPGDRKVTVAVDDGRLSGSATFGADVANVAPAVTAPADRSATEGTTASVALGRFADPGSDSPWLVTVDWGDHTPAATFAATSAGDLGSLPHDYARYGTYVVTVTVNDGRDAGSATFLANVADVPPAVTGPGDQPEALGATASFALGRFADPGADLLWAVTVDWGDHSPPTSVLAVTPGDLGSMAHEFPNIGRYTVTVTVADGRASGSATFLATVSQATATNPGNPIPPPSGPPPIPPPPFAASFDPVALLAGVTSISVFLAVGPTGTGGATVGAPGVTRVSTRVAQSYLSAATSLVIAVDFPGPAPPGAAAAAGKAKAAGGAATPSAVPVVVVEVALPENPFAPNPTTTTTTTTTATAAGGAGQGGAGTTSSAPTPLDAPNPGGGAVTTVVLVIAFMNQQQVPRSGVFSFGRSARRGNRS